MRHPFALNEDGRRNMIAWLILLVVLIVVAWYALVRDNVPGSLEQGTVITQEEKLRILDAVSQQSENYRLSRDEKQAILDSLTRNREIKTVE
ncbi:MAG: hypothetical protein HY457_02355 [Parcubacteria group bacterium]|nr:hypothetical protein [Parcubacteria group bacterium]